MKGSNSANSPDAADLTDSEAARLAHQIASERFLPISARHYEAYLVRLPRQQNPMAPLPSYNRAELTPVFEELFREAFIEVETFRNSAVMDVYRETARTLIAERYAPKPSMQTGSAAGRQQPSSPRF